MHPALACDFWKTHQPLHLNHASAISHLNLQDMSCIDFLFDTCILAFVSSECKKHVAKAFPPAACVEGNGTMTVFIFVVPNAQCMLQKQPTFFL